MASRLIINIKDLLNVHRVEKQRVEFKASWNTGGTLWQTLHSITAFGNDYLNDDGGYIVIGAEDKLSEDDQVQVRGLPVQNLDKIQREIIGRCKGNIQPAYFPILSPEIYDGKHVLVIWATASENGPHECRESANGEFQHYIRRGSQTMKATREEKTQLLLQHNKMPFDDRMARDSEIGKNLSEDNIESNLVKEFLLHIESNIRDQDWDDPRQLYENMRLVRTVGNREEGHRLIKLLAPRNVALLFFNRAPHDYFRGAQTEVTIYHDNEVIEDKKITGPIDHQIREILDYILATTKEEESPAFVQYPRKALREAIVNAFYHRGYESEHCDPVKVRIYTTHIDIISYPGPHRSLKPTHFLEDSDLPPVKTRNRRVGEFLVKRMLAEEKGTGVKTIFRSMKRNGNFTPVFQFDESYFRVRLPRHPSFMVREVLHLTSQLNARGEKRKAVETLLEFLEKNSDIRSDSLFQKLLELHDNNGKHPNVQKYKEFITDPHLERRAALVSELDKWSEETLDISTGVKIVERLVKEGATSDDLLKATRIAVDNVQEEDKKLKLEANQKAHQLFQAMGDVIKTDAYVSYQYAQCKFNIFLLNIRGKSLQERKVLSSYLKEAEECLNDALQLTSEENTKHLARQNRLLGYVHSRLLGLKMSTTSHIINYYDKAREYNPEIRINTLFIPEGLWPRYQY